MPKRIQRRRTKGWRIPPGAVYVGRPTKWGNPVTVEDCGSAEMAVLWYRRYLEDPAEALAEDARRELRGRDLVCWCRLCPEHADGKTEGIECQDCDPCHADVLIELTATSETEPEHTP